MRSALTLLIDADDTLWENNIHFERVVEAFCALIEARGHARQAARDTLNEIERVRTKVNGYGVKNFQQSLHLACGQLIGPADHAHELRVLEELCATIGRETIRLLPGVRETLKELSGRHRLILFTKGDLDDQTDKVQRSGVREYLHRVDVVREKDVDTYRDAVTRHGLRPDTAWMVGNSPKSDIVPALEAGLGAVYIPHEATWELELGDLPADTNGRLLVLDRFEDLTKHF
jgi:putative hydrolase of the HAD superfamily